VGLVDVAPTILDLVGLPSFAAVGGRSLAKDLLAAREPEARSIFANRRSFPESYRPPLGRQVSVRSGGWKYIRRVGVSDQLFDLVIDPGEKTNRLWEADAAGHANSMLEEIIAYEASMPDTIEVAPLPDDVKENLRALGYAE
jgi:arylsulfatase A-like enzyme